MRGADTLGVTGAEVQEQAKKTEVLLQKIRGTELQERNELGFQRRSGKQKENGEDQRALNPRSFKEGNFQEDESAKGCYEVRQVDVRMETWARNLVTITFKKTMRGKARFGGRLGRKVTS